MSKILITPKINPDLDGVACACAYAEFLNTKHKENQHVAGIYGRPHIEARFLLEKLNVKDEFSYNPTESFDKFIIVDASDAKGMPDIIRPEDVIEVIDHREAHQAQALFSNAKIQVEPVGAAATLIFEKIKQAAMPITDKLMFLLYGAIFSNTLNFKSSVVDQRDRESVKFIENNLSSLSVGGTIEEMFDYKTEYIKNNLEEVFRDDFKIFDYSGKLAIVQIEGFDLDNLVCDKKDEIKDILTKLKNESGLDYIFLTAADIKNAYNIFVAIDENTKLLLSRVLGLSFDDNGIARNTKLLLRKQIFPLLINANKI